MKKIISNFPLHPAQENVYLDQLAHPNSPIYNIGVYMLIEEEVCLSCINQAWKSMVSRYDSLRLEIVPQKEELPLQRVLPADKVTAIVEYLDYSQEHSPEETAHNWMQSQYEKIFDISKSERYQIALLKLTKNRYYIFFRFHHFFCDGISAIEIAKRVYDFYQNPLACHSSEPTSYRAVADSAYSYLQSTRYAKDAAFWKTFLQQHTITRLPRYYQQKNSGIHSVPLTATLSSTVKEFCQTCKISPLTLMLSAVTLYFTQTMDLNELVVSTAVHGRKRKGGMQTIGMHSDTTLVALHMNECHDFNELLLLVNKQLKQSLRYHQFPQSHVSRLLGISHDNLSDIYVNYEVYAQDNKVIQSTHPFINHLSGEANEPLHFRLIDFQDTDQLILRLNYQYAYFQPEEMSYLSKRFVQLLERCIHEPSNPLSKISLLDSQERDLLLHTWNATDAPYPKDNTLYQLFEAQVDKTPDNIALVFEDQQLTYQQLNLRANQLARQIRATYQQRHGSTLSPDTLIALYLDRSLEMIISILAVLKAGGAYVPIAPEYPQSRTLFILEDTKAPLLLTQSHYTGQLDGWISKLKEQPPVLIATDQMSDMESYVTENLSPVSKAQDLAYVIYTSGTTGNPKGVMLSHCSAVNRIHWMQTKYPLTDKDKILQKTPYSFDVSVWEFFWGHWVGATLVVATPAMHKEPAQLYNLMQACEITTVHFVPSMLNVFCDFLQDKHYKFPETVRQIFCSGEVLAKKHVEHFRNISPVDRNCQVYNLYGPTEAAIDVTFFNCSQNNQVINIPIGKPVHNTQLYVLDNKLGLAPISVPGELYIGGAGLARGYLNRPELTAERFIDNPFATEEDIANGYTRLYKTGDLVRWLPDGNLEYLGRNDFQVKIRGYRIELGEIEKALTALPQVSQAVVIDREREGTKYLAAYCIAADTRASKDKDRVTALTDSLRQHLQAILPEYMVPATFTVIEDIPLTINGKLDRHALPAPEFINTDSYVAPRTETETQLCAVWAEVLGLERVGIHDNFFRIGGDSISAIRLTAKSRQMLDKDIALALLFSNPTVARLADKLSATQIIIPVSKNHNHLPLSFAQERLLFIEQYEQGTASYHIPHMVTLDETADDTLLLRAINQLAVRHRVLNSTYHQDNETGMYYTTGCQSPLSYQCGFWDSHNELKLSVQTAIAQPFNLTEEPPLRLCLYRCKHERHLLLVWHHIAFDGWSMAVFMQELAEIYKSLRELRPSQLPALSISYGDYADWQRHYLQGEVLDKTVAHWKQQLAGYETLNLPADYPRPQHIDYQGANDNFNLTEKLSDRLRQLACDKETTLYTILLSGFYLLLNKLSNQSDLVLGTPSDNRHHPQTQALIGFFVNALPLRLQLDSNGTLNTLIEQVHATVADAKTHQELPFEKLVSELNIERDTSRHPVFQVMFSLQSFDTDSDSCTGLPLTTFTAEDKVQYSPAKFDLSLFVDDSDNCIQGQWNYAVGLFTEDTIRRFNAMYLCVLTALVENTTQHLNQIDVLSRQERHTLLHTWNATDAPYPKDNTLYQLFEDQVDKTPDNIALVFENQQLTYRQLNLRANQLARQIRATYQQRHGSTLSPDTLIALYLDRSPEMIISILAVLKAGGAYVPVAPEYPQSRTLFILEDTKAPLLLTQSHYTDQLNGWINKLKGKPPVLIATDQMSDMANDATDNLSPVSKAQDLAYVIYTSGTTGNPKGVMLSQNAFANFISGQKKYYQNNKEKLSILGCSQYVFDIFGLEFALPLICGGMTVLSNTERFQNDLQNHKKNIDIIQQTPSMWQVLLSDSNEFLDCSHIQILVGGESGSTELYESLSGIFNTVSQVYGPTESCIWSSNAMYSKGKESHIGKPLPNEKVYILSEEKEPVAIGVPGELYIGGAGLARGYLNQPELTAERFIDNPFATEADIANGYTRLYKTGDLVRWLPDGNLEYLGRNDFQVKIRGYRIELGEIEKALTALPQVSQAVVIDREREGSKYLAAYCIAADTRAPKDNARIAALTDSLRQHLQASLPEYMVPATFTVIEHIPLTINGKLDRRALPAPEFINTDSYVAPRTEMETQLCAVWAEVLGLERVGIHDNFFRIGGDSILCIQITSRLRQKDLALQVKDIFEAPTVALLAQRLVDTTATVAVETEQGILEGRFNLLPIQQQFFDWTFSDPDHFNQAFMQKIPGSVSVQTIQSALENLTLHHDSLRLCFTQTPSGWQQTYHLQTENNPLISLSMKGLSAQSVQSKLTEHQADLNIEKGPLWKVIHLTGYSDGSARLCFILHHLIIDAVSWRILSNDMQQLLTGHSLPAKTSSYRQWVKTVALYANQHSAQVDYWKGIYDKTDRCHLPLSPVSEHTIQWDETVTQQLLRKAPEGYHTKINDLLLAALGIALSQAFDQLSHVITLEGHGREPIAAQMDTSRTVGWFTIAYPVRLVDRENTAETIIATKEQLRKIPDKGIGFSALQQAGLLESTLADISFNYLGQLGSTDKENMWQLVAESTGQAVSSANKNTLRLNINGAVQNNCLSFHVLSQLNETQTGLFLQAFEQAVKKVTELSVKQAKIGSIRTPSDYQTTGLSIERLRQLQSRYQDNEIEAIYPASSLQQGFVYHDLAFPDDDAYRVQLLLDYHHSLNVPLYKKAWQLASERYPVLRMALDTEGEPLQVILKNGVLTDDHFTEIDLGYLNASEREERIALLQQNDRKQGFNLNTPGLLRLMIIKHSNDHYTIMKTEHHAVSDGWSNPILWQFIHHTYQQLIAKQQVNIASETTYSEVQRYHQQHQAETDTYWKQQKTSWQGATNLRYLLDNPVDLNKHRTITVPREIDLQLTGHTLHQLKAQCQSQGITLNAAVQFAWHKVLQVYSNRNQTIVGTTVSGRDIPVQGIENSVGLYINTLPLTVNWEKEASCACVLQLIQQQIAALNSHSSVSLSSLQSQGECLFHSLLVFENYPNPVDETKDKEKKTLITIRGSKEKTDYPLSLIAYEHDETLTVRLCYDTTLISIKQVTRIKEQIFSILESIRTAVEQPHTSINLLSNSERHTLLHTWNATDVPYPKDNTLYQLFEAQVDKTPDNIALVFENQQLTYRQLNLRANQLARQIRATYQQRHGSTLSPDTLIALYLDRSPEMIISILAVLKAGGAYVPVAPEYPQSRTLFILEDTKAPLLLTQSHYTGQLDSWISKLKEQPPVLIATDQMSDMESYVTENLSPVSKAKDLAYVIYTSGTTGKPKGVMTTHQGVVSLAINKSVADILPTDVFLQLASPNFDAATFEIWSALLHRAKLIIPKSTHVVSEQQITKLLKQHKISILWVTRGLFDSLYRQKPDLFGSLKYLLTGGEVLTPNIIKAIVRQSHRPKYIINGYGPTESTTFATTWISEPSFEGSVPIGRPINTRKVYVLNTSLQLAPMGVVGELYIGGGGLARGYLNQPELTAERFIDNPFATEADIANGYTRLYKTGDLVRWLPDGNLEYLGRNDFQVKIRGYRIELGEIEKALTALPQVSQAVVIDREREGTKYLAAYCIAADTRASKDKNRITALTDSLRQHLQASLPEYMVPFTFTVIEDIPLTINGKLDRHALPAPEFINTDSYVAPRTETEMQLCAVWAEVLGLKRVGIHDNFFRIGGDSILCIQITSRLRQKDLVLQVKDIFEAPTVALLAQRLVDTTATVAVETEQGILEGRFNLLPIQQQFFDWMFSDPDHFNQAFMQKIPGSVSVQTIQSALENLTLHHDSLRLYFTQTPSGWQQTYHLQTENNPLISLSIKGLSAQSVQSKLTEHQADLHIEKGPLWKVIHLTGYSDGSARLCFILHHLIIDAVSWRILSNDMQQLLTGHSLPTKTSSYRQWVKTVALYANQHSNQVDYWKGIYDKTDRCYLPLSPVSEHTIQWEKTVTQQLLRKAPEGYHTKINDLLLAALAIALSQTFDQLSHVITLEGHGREPIAAQMDTSRTVGWFTIAYPVRLVDRENTAETIIATKEQLRKIPDKGIGFSALQQAGLLEPTLADISFNYLGQLGGTDKEDMWQLVAESTGQAVSPANKNTLRLNINGAVQNNCLSFHVLSQLNETQTGLFLQAFEQAVKKVTELSVKQAKIGSIRTPSDYQTTGLSIERLRQLQSRYQNNEIEAIYPASSLQQGFAYHDLAFPDDDAYRVQLLLDYHHSLNVPLYKKAWQLASERYPVLRMALDTEGEPLQVILKNGVLTDDHFTEIDLGYLNASEREERIALLQKNDRKQGFKLNTPGLLRLMIIKHSNDHYTVMKTEHHAVSDGWSNPILWQFIHYTYQQLIAKQQVNIASETTYSEVQRYHQQHQAKTDTYWKQQKTSWQGATNLRYLLDNPVDLNKHRTITVPGEIDLQLAGHALHQLKAQCQSQGITLNAAVQFAWHKVLQVYSNSNQTIVGTTVSGRDIPVLGIENSVGLYINTLPLTVNWEKEASCACVLQLIQQQIAALNSHSSVSLSSLQLQGERLFHSLLVFENYPNPVDETKDKEKKTLITIRGSKEKTDYPLSLIAYEHDKTLTVRLCYDTTLISIKQVTRIKEQIFSILESISTAVEQPHTSINLLSNSERHTFLHTWNATDAPYPKDNTLYQVFEAQVDKTPDNIALVFENQQLTYRQLNLRANQLARQIRATYQQRHGSTLSPDTLIALYLDRSPEMIISILAVLKAGGAYVPVAPEYPQSRTLFILEDTKAPLLLTQNHYTGQLDGWISKLKEQPLVLIATDQISDMENYATDNLSPISKTQDLAYVIYTSGTTGQPKGVMIEHESVINLSQFVMRTHYLSDELHVLLFSNYVFDASVYELFPSLFSGCQLFMASEHQQKDITQLIALINEQAIKKAFIPTAFMNQFSKELSNTCLEVVHTGGDKLNILDKIPATTTFNQYGPTETTVCATQSLLHDTASISLGKAIDNTRLYVLDNNNQPSPISVPGELYIGGVGLARGYLNQPELTAEWFIDNPFATDADIANGYTRLYKTGDLVRWLPDGNLEYLGRNDFQVKIRGYRIELGEIEKALTALPQVSQAVLIDREREDNKYLAAYCIAADTRASKDKNRITALTDSLRQQLQVSLPEYMVPATFTVIEHIPLTINGKLDRHALPAPEFMDTDSYVAPRTETETQLCAVWADVLGLKRVGIHDNFFRIGGDSILCIQITSRLRQKDLVLQVKDIFEAPTVALLAQRLVDTTATVAVETEQGILEGRFNLLPIQQQFFDWTFSDPDHFNQAFMQKIPGSVSVQTIQSALENLTLHHDSLRLCFTQTPSGWQQTYHLQTENTPLISLSIKGLSVQSVQSKLTEHQADLNIEKGPLWKVIHLTGYSDGSARLCFILHHLIIDAVSWRILSNDMQQLLTGHSLPTKTSSYRQWVKTVALYANQHSAQVDYWKGIYDKTDRCHLPLSPLSEHTIQWDKTVTQQLLRKAPEGYHTQINDLLLAALAIALSQTFDQLSHVITLEGHGREPIAAQMDTSRTVGWFTIAYPVRLVDRENTAETIIATKEQLRKIPDKGIGFSALQQAGLLEPTLADISFNYLGQLGGTDKENMWQLVAESTGQAVSSANKNTLRLNINGAVQNNCLSFHVLSQLNETQTDLFLQAFEQAVKKVTKVSVNRAKTGGIRTPSDYQTTGLSIERLRQLQSRYQDNEIEAIYPASSLQQGFVYHDLAFPDDDAYRVQLLLDYHHSLNVPLYKKAWQLASERYPVLRMALDTEGEPLQVILKNGVLTDDHFTEIDLGYLNASEREERIALLQQNDRKQGFNLNTPGLLRLMIIKHSNDHYTVMKTEHHAVSDGWSNPILWQFIHHTYQQLIAKQQVNIASETTYSEVQRYHQQHQAETDTYWKQQKTSWQGATNLRYLLDNPVDLNKHRTITVPGEIDLQLTGHTLHQLKAQCQSQGITLNAAVQFAWHKVLQVYSNSNQTIVGTTVSGRDIPVQGIENSVGLYINTLPLTVNWEKEASCACVLQLIQQQIAALNSHSSVSLSSLQSQGERLFHSLLVFENYPNPIDETKDKEKKTLITMRGSKEKTDYPLSLIAYEHDETLTVRLCYDTTLISIKQVTRIKEQIFSILESISTAVEQPHTSINLLSNSERHTLLHTWNATDAPYPKDNTLYQLFEDR